MQKLTGQKLADVYGYRYACELQKLADVSQVPTIHARYIGGGWIEIYGSGLPPHKDLRAVYPNGWTLWAKVRSKKKSAAVCCRSSLPFRLRRTRKDGHYGTISFVWSVFA